MDKTCIESAGGFTAKINDNCENGWAIMLVITGFWEMKLYIRVYRGELIPDSDNCHKKKAENILLIKVKC